MPVLRQHLFWEMLLVVSKRLAVGGIIVSDEDGIVGDAQVTIEPLEAGLSQGAGVPTCPRLSERSTQRVNDRLGNQRHGQRRVAHMPVVCAGALPAAGLLGIEELLARPTLGRVAGERWGCITVGGAQQSFAGPRRRPLAPPLQQQRAGTALGLARGGALWRGGVSRPLPGALFGRDGLKTGLQ